jgi:hypothetical protein
MEHKTSFIQLTKGCRYECRHCRVFQEENPPLYAVSWDGIVQSLKKLGVDSAFFGGKDTWESMNALSVTDQFEHKTVYTSAHPETWNTVKASMFGQLHVSLNYLRDKLPATHSESQAFYARTALLQMVALRKKENLPIRLSAHCTISTLNACELLAIYRFCLDNGIYPSFSYLHTNTDGKFRMFRKPSDDVISPMIIKSNYILDMIKRFTDSVYVDIHREQRKELQYLTDFLSVPLKLGVTGVTNTSRHCKGCTPLSVGSNGKMMLCPFRRGDRSKNFEPYMLTNVKVLREFNVARIQDASECPGCTMTLPYELSYRKGFGDV